MRWAVGVGGNLGNVAATAERARQMLVDDGVVVVAMARWVRTAPVGGPPQPDYWNSAWLIDSGLGPHQLLDALRRAEAACGRVRDVRWGPRTLDLDLLLAEDGSTVASPALEIPHPRMHERGFVLGPLAEIAPGWRHPLRGASVAELALRLRPAG